MDSARAEDAPGVREKSAAAAPAMDARRPIADEGWDVDAFSLESLESVARILVAARGARAAGRGGCRGGRREGRRHRRYHARRG